MLYESDPSSKTHFNTGNFPGNELEDGIQEVKIFDTLKSHYGVSFCSGKIS